MKNVEAGCGGFVNLTDVPKQSFRTQKGSTYDSLEDCHWRVIAPEGKNIKFTINSMDIKNAMNGNGSKCTGDYIEVKFDPILVPLLSFLFPYMLYYVV